MPESTRTDILLGEVIGQLKGIDRRLDRQDESRARLHARVDDVARKQESQENELVTIRKKVEAHEEVTMSVKALRNKAEGAGTLGKWLIRIGIGVVTFAGWLVGVYTYLTGRPPP